MTMVLAICVAVTFAVSIYLMLGRELKGVAMGVFLLGHAANLSILAMSGSPVQPDRGHVDKPAEILSIAEQLETQAESDGQAGEAPEQHADKMSDKPSAIDSPDMKNPPIMLSQYAGKDPLDDMVDPLPQALILTAIVISFGVMAFLLTLLVVTNRKTHTIEVDELAGEEPSA